MSIIDICNPGREKAMKKIAGIIVLTLIAAAQVEAKEIRYGDILSDPSKYIGKTVTMNGRFAYTEPLRGSFTFEQNGTLIEVFYGDLPQEIRDSIASQKESAKTPVVVTGVLQRYTNIANKYFINATSVQMAGGYTPSPNGGASILFESILLSPTKYLGKTVTMSGIFSYTEPMRGSFTFEQNGNPIEVFYGDLPQKTRDLIASQKAGGKAPVVVTGMLQRYTNMTNKYFINASSVSFNY